MKRILGFCLIGFSALSAWGAGAPLILDWGVVDTSSAVQQTQSRALRSATRAATVQSLSVEGTAPWLVQFNDVIREEWKAEVEAAGAKLKGYIPENAYLIEATPTQIATIGALAEVSWVGEYLPAYKRAAKVRAKLARVASATEIDSPSACRVLLISEEDLNAVAQKIEALTGVAVAAAAGDILRTDLTAAQVETVSGWGEVQWIEPYSRPRMWNNVAAQTNMMNVSNVWTTLGLTGAGQTIAVADTGLDTGNTGTLHRDFTNRVTGFGWTNEAYSPSTKWADFDEHGTHVCGSVLGNGTMSTGLYKGIAYEASLIIQGTQADLDGIPTTGLTPLFRQAFTNGARIHSDSWGWNDYGYYNDDSRYVDQYIWSNKTMLICIAAGNSGTDSNTVDGVIDLESVASPATAKNCLTVGAAESFRTSGGYAADVYGTGSWTSDYFHAPIANDYISRPFSNSIQGMAAFSSRGPCNDGRIKPDIVAPGTDIISTRTRAASGEGWGVAGNTNYLYMGGTSMATPLTAGAAGLTRQWVTTTGGITNPSGQLLKALMLNGARNMAPGQYGTGTYQEIPAVRPNNVEGWGHVDLLNTLKPATNQFLSLYDTNSLSTGQTNIFTLTVSATSTNKFILTMAYADYWGTAGSGKQLINDLDLKVQKPSGSNLYANGRTSVDATNNVEMIEFAADEVGTYTVRVVGRTVPSGSSQAYALVIRGPLDDTPLAPTFGANPGPVSTTTGVAVAFTVSAGGNPVPVLALQSQTATSGYSFVPATGVLTYTPPVADVGTKTFTFTATNTEGAATQTVSVVVYEALPAAPATIWASATNTTDFTAAWSSVSGATSYRLDVATNSFSGGGGGATELFISEYIEADSGSEKYIEIFNGTGSAVDLGNYNLLMFINGSTSPTTITLSGTLANNDVFVVANSSATNAAVIDQTSGSLTFNGDDAIALSNTTTHAYVDILGQIGTDPGSAWGTDPTTTANSTLVRKSSIVAGDTNGTDAFDPATEWDGYAGVNVEDNLGSHTFAGGGGAPSYVPGYSNRTVAGTSQSVTGLTAGATYYFRARAVSGGGTSTNSATASVTTTVSSVAPSFGANPGPVATTSGVAVAFTVSASGSPAPVLALQSTTASAGYSFTPGTGQLSYTPPQADGGATKTFTFTASNSVGMATQTVSVAVTAGTAPSFTGGAGPYATTTGVAVAFTVSASGNPAATLALKSTTASNGYYSFTPGTGQLSYTPPAGDIGTQTFTFTASNVAGVVTQVTSVVVSDVPATAPSFGANPGPVSTTTGVAVAFTVSATGNPAPTLALQSTTAASGYSFTGGTGQLNYTPPEADAGTKTFTFTASNSAGVATQTVSVAVTAGIPGAPGSIWASATNATGFTAAWSSALNATGYRLDVGTNATFTGGGGGSVSTNLIAFDFAGYGGSEVQGTSTYAAASMQSPVYITRGTGLTATANSDRFNAQGWANHADASTAFAAGDYFEWTLQPASGYAMSITNVTLLIQRSNSGASNLALRASHDGYVGNLLVQTDMSGTATITVASNLTAVAGLQNVSGAITFRMAGWWGASGGSMGFEGTGDDILIQGTLSNGSGGAAYVPGYSNLTVAGTSQSVTGLTANSTYYFRARAVNGSGTSSNSAVANVTTATNAPAGTPPVMNAVASQAALTGRDVARTVTATPTDGDPILSFACTSVVNVATWDFDTGTGYFLFIPTAGQIGANVFTFTATDKDGTSSPVAMTVTVSAASAPTVNPISAQITGVGATFEYTATATEPDGDAVTFACTSAVDEATWAVDTNGYFLFQPTVAQIGTNLFSFTASDRDGTSAPVALVVKVNSIAATNAFEEWVAVDQGQDPGNPNFATNADYDLDGATTWEEYLADTDPNLSNSVLVLTGRYTIASTSGGTGSIRMQFPASTSRYYQLEYCTGLAHHDVGVSNLGWGVPGMAVTNASTGTWYGVIRALLQAP